MARNIHRLPKVLLNPTMPNPSKPHGRATPKTALWRAYSRLLPSWIPHVVQVWGGFRENREGPNYQVLLEGGEIVGGWLSWWEGKARMARGIHRLSKVLPGPTMPNLSMSCPVLYIRNGLTSVSEVVHPQGGLRPSSTPLDIPRRTGLGGQPGKSQLPGIAGGGRWSEGS